MNKTTCGSDPFSTRLLMSHIYAIVPILFFFFFERMIYLNQQKTIYIYTG